MPQATNKSAFPQQHTIVVMLWCLREALSHGIMSMLMHLIYNLYLEHDHIPARLFACKGEIIQKHWLNLPQKRKRNKAKIC